MAITDVAPQAAGPQSRPLPDRSPPPAESRPRLAHEPALDGLRGLAVLGVVLFHSGFSWAVGGYLGVSTFFTLSGFLITGLLVAEWRATGTIRLRRFWARRFRRLGPALLLTLAGTAAFAWLVADPDQLTSLRADALAALGYVANWRFVADGQSYGDLFGAPSPLLHTWSLGIEEQFYVLFPLLVAGVLWLARGSRRALSVVLGALVVSSVLAAVAIHRPGADPSRVYYGTDTRAVELLLGALLAIALATWGKAVGRRAGRVAAVVGLAGLAGTLAAWALVEQSSGWLYEGGLGLYALGTVAVLVGAVHAGPVRTALSWRPLRALGIVSYGVYLYHWPVFLWLTPGRTGLSTVPLLLLRSGVTLTLAVASYRLVESPVRHGAVRTRRLVVAAPAVVALVVAALVVSTVPPGAPSRLVAGAAPAAEQGAPAAGAAEARAAVGTRPAAPLVRDATAADPLRVLVLGDSVGYDAAPGIAGALRASGEATVAAEAVLGFGLTDPPIEWRAAWDRLLVETSAEVVVVMFGGWDSAHVERAGPDAYAALVDDAVGLLTARGARLVVIGVPASVDRDGTPLARPVNDVFEALPGRWPDAVDYVDPDPALSPGGEFVAYLDGPDGAPERLRKVDGVHLCPAGAARIGDAVRAAVAPLYGLAPPDPGWRAGEWALDPRYDDPRGSCPA